MKSIGSLFTLNTIPSEIWMCVRYTCGYYEMHLTSVIETYRGKAFTGKRYVRSEELEEEYQEI